MKTSRFSEEQIIHYSADFALQNRLPDNGIARLHVGRAGRRAQVPGVERYRRLQSRMPGSRRGHILERRSCRPLTGEMQSCGAKLAISDLVRRMKGRSSYKVQREFPAIRRRYRGCELAPVSTGHLGLTKPNHPWTNGQVGRMNRTIRDATVKRYHYDSHELLRDHLKTFLDACNFAKRLKSLKGLAVFEFFTEMWASEPDRFKVHPNHLSPGPNSWKPVTDTKAEPPSQLRETKRASTHPQPKQVEQAQLHFAGAAALKLF